MFYTRILIVSIGIFIIAVKVQAQPAVTFADEADLIQRLRTIEFNEYSANYSYSVSETVQNFLKTGIPTVVNWKVAHKMGSMSLVSELVSPKKTDGKPQSMVYTRTPETQFLIHSKKSLFDEQAGAVLKSFDSDKKLEEILTTEKKLFGDMYTLVMPLTCCALHQQKGLLSDFLTKDGYKIVTQKLTDNSLVVIAKVGKNLKAEMHFRSLELPVIIKMDVIGDSGYNAGNYGWAVEREIVEARPGVYMCKTLDAVLHETPQKKVSTRRQLVFSDYQFVSVSDATFSMEKYGMPEPVSAKPRPSSIMPIVFVIGAIFSILAFSFVYLRRRSQNSKDA